MSVAYHLRLIAIYSVFCIGLGEAADYPTCSTATCYDYLDPPPKNGNEYEQCATIGPLCNGTQITRSGFICFPTPDPASRSLRIDITPIQDSKSSNTAQNRNITMRLAVDFRNRKIGINTLLNTWGKPQFVPGDFPFKRGAYFGIMYAIVENRIEIHLEHDGPKRDSYSLDDRSNMDSNHELCVHGCTEYTDITMDAMSTERCQALDPDCYGHDCTNMDNYSESTQSSIHMAELGDLFYGKTFATSTVTSSHTTVTRIEVSPETRLDPTPSSIKVTPESDEAKDVSLAHGEILTIVGLCFSMFFLTLTMIILVYNKTTTKTPGKIMFSLCLSLFLAQFLFLFIDYPFSSSLTCKILAIAEHYLWLLALSWSNTMVIDLVRVIGNATPTLHRTSLNRYPFYAVIAGVFPCGIITACTILDSLSIIVKYGTPNFCWINFSRARTYFFIIPVGVSILTNVVLLIIIFAMIYRIRRRMTTIGDGTVFSYRRNAIIGLKLASVMGLTWIFGFLGGILQNSVLLYMFTVINSFQGVIIFFGMVYNHSKLKTWLGDKITCYKRDDEATKTEQTVT